MKITAFCIKRPVTTVMFIAALVVLGIVSSSKMPIDLYPQITYPAINISCSYSGAGPEEIEQLITIPLEQAVATVNKVTSISAVSQEGSSRVTVYFDWGVNLDAVSNDIRTNLDRVSRRLPDEAGTPSLFKFDPSAMPIMTIGLSGQMDESALRKLAEESISYQLQKIDGVASVDVRGGRGKEIRVEVNQARLQALGLTIDQISSAIRNENVMQPSGKLEFGAVDFLLRTRGELTGIDDLRNLVVTVRNGTPIFLRDVANISEAMEKENSLVRIDGVRGITLSLQKRSGSNTVAVADEVYKAIDEISRNHPDINIRVLNDSSIYIRRSVSGVANSAVLGAILAGLILLIFLHNFKATLAAALAMPISIMATLILAYFGKMTLNTISLGGLALGVGMLVDNAVVVLDNIFRKYKEENTDVETAALDGTTEMGSAITASTLTTICVFFPLVYISGRTGLIFKELSYMVVFSLICSLGVAVTLIPMFCAKFLKHQSERSHRFDKIVNYLVYLQESWEETYRGMLAFCLKHKWLTLSVSLAILVGSLCLWPLIGSEMVTQTDEGLISVNLSLPNGTKFEEITDIALKLESSFKDLVPEIEHMETSVDQSSRRSGASFTLRLESKKTRKRSTAEIIQELQSKVSYPGARIRITARNSMRMLYGNSQSPIVIDIRGYDQQLAKQTAELVMAKISQIPGISNADLSREEERPELNIRINRKRAADLGVPIGRIGSAIQTSIQGSQATVIRKNGEETSVKVSLQESETHSQQILERITVAGNNNRTIPLMSLIELEPGNSPVSIERKNQERNMTVQASYSGNNLSETMNQIKKSLGELKLPPGINLYYAGDYEEQQKSFNELTMAIIMALLLVYMVMAAQFESYLDPLLIMFSVPFTLGGVMIMLLLTDTSFDTQVYIGLIILGGIVVNNAIVLVSYFRLLMERGVPLKEAVLNGATTRLRPILMTTVTTILGLVPLALAIGEGSELQAPMARTVIGGLTFSTILTLFIIPVIFLVVENFLANFKAKRVKRSAAAAILILIISLTLIPLRQAAAAETKTETKLNINQAVSIALSHSEDGKIIQGRKETANSDYLEAIGGKAWQVYGEAETTYREDSTNPSKVSLNFKKSTPLANLQGLESYSDQVSVYNRDISLYGTVLQEETLINKVVSGYQSVLLAQRDLELSQEKCNRATRFLEEVKVRSKLGLTTITEETEAESQVVTAQTDLNRAERLYQLTCLSLSQLLNQDNLDQVILEEPAVIEISSDLDSLLKTAISKRVDLKQADVELIRAETLLKIAKLSEKLGVSLNWEFERDNFSAGIGISNQNQQTTGEWNFNRNASFFVEDPERKGNDDNGTLKLVLRWNFYDGNVTKERIKQAELLVAQQSETKKKLLKSVEYEVKEAYYNYLYQQDRLQSSEMKLSSKRIALEAAEAKLRNGLASVKDVLDAQDELNQAETDFERTKSNLYLSQITLLKVTGQLTPGVFN